MYMVERLDAGDMISKVEVEIDELDNVGTLHDKLSVAGAALLKRYGAKCSEGLFLRFRKMKKRPHMHQILQEQERLD